MRVSAKADYAVRAMVELAAADSSEAEPAKGETLATAQAIPLRFLENILGELRVHGLVHSRRGADGGYWLARDAGDVSLAEIIRAVEGPLATVRGEAADEIEYRGGAEPLRQVWLALAGEHPPGARIGDAGRRGRRIAAGADRHARRTRAQRSRSAARRASPLIWRNVAQTTMPTNPSMSASIAVATIAARVIAVSHVSPSPYETRASSSVRGLAPFPSKRRARAGVT